MFLFSPGTGQYTSAADSTTTIAYGGGRAAVERDQRGVRGYDGLHRLTSDTLTTAGGTTVASVSYGYDVGGDLTSKTGTGFAGAGTSAYGYDQAGRLTSWDNRRR